MKKVSPLQTGRFYKVKRPKKNFLCALCSAPRSMKYGKNLDRIHFIQITVLSAALIWFLFPFMKEKSFFLFFIVWGSFEVINKMLYRKEIPCPYCGFDATWYRRDVRVANQKVKEYWLNNYPELVNKSAEVDRPENEVQRAYESETYETEQSEVSNQ